jgi:hypothetical protein
MHIFSSFIFVFSVLLRVLSPHLPPFNSLFPYLHLATVLPTSKFPSYLFGPSTFSHPGTWIFKYSPFCSFPAARILSSVFSAPTSTGRSAAWEPRSVLSHCLCVSWVFWLGFWGVKMEAKGEGGGLEEYHKEKEKGRRLHQGRWP